MTYTMDRILLKDDEVLVRVIPHTYDDSKGAHGCLVPHENGMPCSKCSVCGESVAWDEWESGCKSVDPDSINL